MKHPSAGRVTIKEWLALGLIVVCFALIVGALIGGVVFIASHRR